jgi:hypothetical protein
MVVYGPDDRRFLTFEELRQRSTRLAELSRKARKQQATAEELTELERLEDELAEG